ncbi:hypothetical protein J2X83_003406 [Brevibacillus nitrificans]|nr:hypothetical protein [Brevibacillus nitrificans]
MQMSGSEILTSLAMERKRKGFSASIESNPTVLSTIMCFTAYSIRNGQKSEKN